ncbi:aldo/keto reductase [Acidihalobacter aeolianus]|uniref:Aldo/keto reductase n=1 Tax=Acidihalobacter aeolianus TaxID=2792603 RepID=A0A1D8K473_9GAMM|nr:aldo/keto reductase [Acidihalobacter aeolianus]AOV15760.1 aldo/keto reductase [Acidihalobacter aeolianus]
MNYRQLGRTGLKVSELCLGAMTFGSNFLSIAVVGQNDADALVSRAIESGVNFFDTADVYSYGESEEILGKALKQAPLTRDQAVIATKVRSPMSRAASEGSGDPNNVGLSRKHIMTACEASLRRLGTDYIDLYQVHGWDIRTPLEEALRTLDDLVRQGKVRYIGASNWSVRHLAQAVTLADAKGWERFASLQAYYALAGRDLEHELQPYCVEAGLGIMPWSPLAGGYLTGKFRRDHSGPEGARRSGFDFPPVDARVYDAIDALEAVAGETGASVPQVALAWLLTRPGVSSVIIGAKNMAQLEDNLGAPAVSLTEEQIARLSATTAPLAQYPAWMIERQNSGR